MTVSSYNPIMRNAFLNIFSLQNNWLEKQQNSILSAASVITVASIISAFSGLLVKRVLITQFFDTQKSQEALEAFWVAFQIPDLLFQLIVLGALSAAFIPIFTRHKKQNSKKAFVMSSIMMNVLLLAFLIVSIIIFIFARPLTLWRTGDAFTAKQVEVVVNLTRLMLLSQFFFAISNFMTGILQSFQRFVLPAIAPIMYNLGILLGVITLNQYLGIYAAGVGVIIGAFLHMLIQIPLVFKLGFRYKFSLNLRYQGITEFFHLMPPRALSLGASELRKLFLGFFTTSLGNLSFFIMQLGLTIMIIPIRFFGVPIGQASLPFLSSASDEKDKENFLSLLRQSLHQISFLSVPASVLVLILRIPIVRLIFGTFNFPWETTIVTGRVVGILSLSIALQSLSQLLTRAFYALKDTKTPLFIAFFDLAFYLFLASFFVFGSQLQLYGLALATSITAALELCLLFLLLQKKLGNLIDTVFLTRELKILIASFLMAVFLYLPFKIFDELVFDTSRTIELVGLTISTSTIGLLVYTYFALLFDIPELQQFLKLLTRFGPWKKTLSETEELTFEANLESNDSI